MKTKRINLPNDVKYQQTIDNYLSDIYNKKGRFTELQKGYEEIRKTETSKEYMTDPAIKKATAKMHPDNAWSFFLYLAIGQEEAAYYLAVSFVIELGAEQNDDLASLAMAIGIEFGDKKSKELAGDESFKEIKYLTDQCVEQIRKNAKEIGKREITYEEAIGRAKVFDNIVKNKLHLSFEDNILPGSMKTYANFVAIEGDL